MGAVWSALLVGGGLAGALFVWLLRGGPGDAGKDGDAEPQDDPLGQAADPGGHQGDGSGGLSPGPSKRELVTKPESLQESNGHLISETKCPGNLQEALQRLQTSGGHGDSAREHAPTGQIPGTCSLATSEMDSSRAASEVSRNTSLDSSVREWRIQKGQETSPKAATCFAKTLPSESLLMDRAVEGQSLAQLKSQDSTDHEDWEMVSRHSSWGDIGLGSNLEASGLSQEMNCGRNTLMEAKGWEVDGKTQRVAAVASEPQQVSVRFQVHYLTSTDRQFIAVTGDHEDLGRWNTYIPLHRLKDGLWAHSVSLPVDTVVEWKFVLVENGEVTRWEECSNRRLETGQEDKVVHGLWGIH